MIFFFFGVQCEAATIYLYARCFRIVWLVSETAGT